MTQIPNTTEVNQLGASLAIDGFSSHEAKVSELTQLARTIEPESAMIAELADRSNGENVRSRAFSKLAADWTQIRAELVKRSGEFDQALAKLLNAWNSHEDLRSSGGSVSELFASRNDLNANRTQVAEARKALPISC